LAAHDCLMYLGGQRGQGQWTFARQAKGRRRSDDDKVGVNLSPKLRANNSEVLRGDAGNSAPIGTRNENLYEAGGGVLWGFAPQWEVGPSLLYIRDRSKILGNNYSSTEISLILRRDF
jgi:hypothetical protein